MNFFSFYFYLHHHWRFFTTAWFAFAGFVAAYVCLYTLISPELRNTHHSAHFDDFFTTALESLVIF